jgi:thiamine biosynthesis lipoprotein
MKIRNTAILLIVIILLTSCALENRRKRVFFAMGNIPVEVTLYSKENLDFESALQEIQNEIFRLDTMLSKYNQSSAVYKFNASAVSSFAPSEMRSIYSASDSLGKISGGLFDVRAETVLSYYKRCEELQRDISDDSIDAMVMILKKDSIYIKGDSIFKSNPLLKIDFGGIAKGYFGDRVIDIMKKYNFKKGIVNLGGDIVAFNESDKAFFKIGIRSSKDDSIVRIDSILNGSIVTSGDYFRYYEINGKKYCHIINPLTGFQHNEIHSVTVKAPSGAEADAFATALMLMTGKEREVFLENNKDISVFIQ